MDINEKLIHLLTSLKKRNRPRDDTLIPNLSTTLSDYCHQHGYVLNVASRGIFDLDQLQDLDSDILSFFLQVAGLCGSVNDEGSEDLRQIEKFLVDVMRDNSSDTSIICGWVEAMTCILSKHNKKTLSEEILNHICQCMFDKSYFVRKTCLSLIECLIENNINNPESRNMEFIITSCDHKLKNNMRDLLDYQTILNLMEKIFVRGESSTDNMKIPISWRSIFSYESIEILRNIIYKLPKDEIQLVNKILNVLDGLMRDTDISLGGEICKILAELICMDEKLKTLHVAAWMLRHPSFEHIHSHLKCLFLSPLCHEINESFHIIEGYAFSNSLFDSDILRFTFNVIGRQNVIDPSSVFDACLKFLDKNCVHSENKGKYNSKCINACLDAIESSASKLQAENINVHHRLCIVQLLLAFKEDQLAISRTLKIIETILTSYLNNITKDDDDGDCSELFKTLQEIMKNNILDIRNNVITLIGLIFKSDVSSNVFQKAIAYNLHILVWESLQAEDSYVRAIAVDSLLILINSPHIMELQNQISQKDVIENVLSVVTNDDEAFARRAAACFIGKHILLNHKFLFHCSNASITIETCQNIKHLVQTLISVSSMDHDWEVKRLALKFFKEFLLDILFPKMWSHYKNMGINNFEKDKTKVDENIYASKIEMEVASSILRKIIEARDDCYIPVEELANSILNDLSDKITSIYDGALDFSGIEFTNFVSCFCDGMSSEIDRYMGSLLISEDIDPMEELSSIFEDIELCKVPCIDHEDECYTTDDDDEYLDCGLVDCY